jgi:hypothetical protein
LKINWWASLTIPRASPEKIYGSILMMSILIALTADLIPESQKQLNNLVAILKAYPKTK